MIVQRTARSKLNLSLEVSGRLVTGFHLLRSIVCATSLADIVSLEVSESLGSSSDISVSTTFSPDLKDHYASILTREAFAELSQALDSDKNLAVKAAKAFFSSTSSLASLRIQIQKSIPIQGGLGGASADAAAVLSGLNQLFENRLTQSELVKLGSEIGSDVAACIVGGLSLMYGTGNSSLPLVAPDQVRTGLTSMGLVIIKPSCGISTPEAYADLGIEPLLPAELVEEFAPLEEPDISKRLRTLQLSPVYHDNRIKSLEKLTILEALGSREPLFGAKLHGAVASVVRNDFERGAIRKFPSVAQALDALESNGAITKLLCGSGSSVCGFFGSRLEARGVAASLSRQYSPRWYVRETALEIA